MVPPSPRARRGHAARSPAPTLTSSPPRPLGGPLRHAAQARSAAVSAATEPGPGASQAGRRARGEGVGPARRSAGELEGQSGAARRLAPAGRAALPLRPLSGVSATASQLRLGWPGGPRGLVSVRAERPGRRTAARAAGVRAQLPAGEGREDRMAPLKLKPCLRFRAGWRAPPPSRRQFHSLRRAPRPRLPSVPRCFFPNDAFGVGTWDSWLVAGPGWGQYVARGWRSRVPVAPARPLWAPGPDPCHAGPQALPAGMVTLRRRILCPRRESQPSGS